LALWGFERARRGSGWWLVVSGAALASIPLSGQVHLALGAIPFFLLYALVRSRRLLPGVAACAVAAVGAGILVRQAVIVGSTQSGGRSLDEVAFYSARAGDFLTRHVDHSRSEQFVFLGWLTPLLALAGLVLLIRERRRGLAAVLGVGALVPILLALGTRFPLYTVLWHTLPPFRFPRVPERLLPIACLCIAALVAVLVARVRMPMVAAVVIVVLFADLHVRLYGKSFPDTGNPAYAVLADRGPQGRLLEIPVFDPGVHYGSVYLWYDTGPQRQRPSGYSTTAPKAAKTLASRLERLNCGDWSGNTGAVVQRLGVTAIAFHRGLFVNNQAVPDTTYFALRGLQEHGWTAREASGVVWLFAHDRSGPTQTVPEPVHYKAFFCQGWYGQFGPLPGRFMSERHAPFWIYGTGPLRLFLAPSSLPKTYTVDGRAQRGPLLQLGSPGWHIVTIDVPRLVKYRDKKVGVRLLGLLTYPSRGTRSPRTASSP
jgi:hypothetical protein